jgi:hypothetical protein
MTQADVGVAVLDLQHHLQVERVAQPAAPRDVQHDDPTVRVRRGEVVAGQEVEDRDVVRRDVGRRPFQVGFQPQEAAPDHARL